MDRPDYSSSDKSTVELIERDFCMSHRHSRARRLEHWTRKQKRSNVIADAFTVAGIVIVVVVILLLLKSITGA